MWKQYNFKETKVCTAPLRVHKNSVCLTEKWHGKYFASSYHEGRGHPEWALAINTHLVYGLHLGIKQPSFKTEMILCSWGIDSNKTGSW